MAKYMLSVGCLFRNEGHSIREWIEHYLLHGVEHFYLIDDGSDDDSCLLLAPYVRRGLVTLFSGGWDRYLGRQRDMYNHYILPAVLRGETAWLLMCDMDEYVWSPESVDLRLVLARCGHLGQIQVDHTLYGSSEHELQPASVVAGFCRRSSGSPTLAPGNRKYFINCRFAFSSLNIHHATFVDLADEKERFLLLNAHFKMNHYSCQSRSFWLSVKCRRGDGDNWRTRTPADFDELDVNDVYDDGLLQQNAAVIASLGLPID